MNFCVSSLRQALRGEGNINYIQRTPGGLSLALDFLGDHDVLPLQDSLQRGEALASSDPTQSFLSRLDALRLATQEVLTGCDMDWAETLRAKIHERLMEAGHFCLEFAEKTHAQNSWLKSPRTFYVSMTFTFPASRRCWSPWESLETGKKSSKCTAIIANARKQSWRRHPSRKLF